MSKMNNIIKPENFGATVSKGHVSADKWDVKFDKDHFWVDANGMHLRDSVLKPIRDKGIASGDLNSKALEFTRVDGTKVTIDLSLIIPESTTDTFLKSVEYDNATTELVFTVGSETENKGTYRVNVSDLLPVASEGVIEGNGTTAHPLVLKVDAGSGITVTEDGVSFSGSIELEDSFGESIGYLVAKGKTCLPPPIITDEGDWVKIDYSVYPLDQFNSRGITYILTNYSSHNDVTPDDSSIGSQAQHLTDNFTWSSADLCGNTGPFLECKHGYNNSNHVYKEFRQGYVLIHKKSILPLSTVNAYYGLKRFSDRTNCEEYASTNYSVPAKATNGAYIIDGVLHLGTSFKDSTVYSTYGLHSSKEYLTPLKTSNTINKLGQTKTPINTEITSVTQTERKRIEKGMTFLVVTPSYEHNYAELADLALINQDGAFRLHSKDYITYKWVDDKGQELKPDEIIHTSTSVGHGDIEGYTYSYDQRHTKYDEVSEIDFIHTIKYVFTRSVESTQADLNRGEQPDNGVSNYNHFSPEVIKKTAMEAKNADTNLDLGSNLYISDLTTQIELVGKNTIRIVYFGNEPKPGYARFVFESIDYPSMPKFARTIPHTETIDGAKILQTSNSGDLSLVSLLYTSRVIKVTEESVYNYNTQTGSRLYYIADADPNSDKIIFKPISDIIGDENSSNWVLIQHNIAERLAYDAQQLTPSRIRDELNKLDVEATNEGYDRILFNYHRHWTHKQYEQNPSVLLDHNRRYAKVIEELGNLKISYYLDDLSLENISPPEIYVKGEHKKIENYSYVKTLEIPKAGTYIHYYEEDY